MIRARPWLALVPLAVCTLIGCGGADEPQGTLETARALYHDGWYTESESLGRALLLRAEDDHGEASPEVADVIDLLVRVLDRGGKLREPQTLELARRAVEIREREQGPKNPALAGSLHNLGIVLRGHRELEEAQDSLERALELRRESLGPTHAEIAETLTSLGIVLLDLGGDESAVTEALDAAVAMWDALDGDNPVGLADTWQALGGLHYNNGEPEKTRELFARAAAIRRINYGEDHPLVASSLYNVGALDQVLGNYAQAAATYDQVLQLQLQRLDADHPLVLSTRAGLATLLQINGDYVGARAQYRLALEGFEKRLGVDDPRYVETLINLANLLVESGDYDEATALFERVLANHLELHTRKSAVTADTMASLGAAMRLSGSAAAARPYFEQALEIQDEIGDWNPLNRAWTLQGYSLVLSMLGESAEARSAAERALELRETAYGENHHTLVPLLAHLGELLVAADELEEASRLFQRALDITDRTSGRDHHSNAALLEGEAITQAAMGNAAEAFDLALRAEAVGRAHVGVTALQMTERQALAYSASQSERLNLLLSLMTAEHAPISDATQSAWDAVAQGRGLVLDEMASRNRVLAGTDDRETAVAVEQLRSVSRQLANLMVRGPAELAPEHYRKLLEDTRRRRESAEESLAATSLAFRRDRARKQLGLQDIASSLPPSTALVAFVRYDRTDGSGQYLAFVLQPDRSRTEWVGIGAADEIDELVTQWRRQASRGIAASDVTRAEAVAVYRRIAGRLRERVWDPLVPHLEGAERVFLVPDGSLNLVNVAALPVGTEGYLVETGPTIHVMSTERDVVRAGDLAEPSGRLLAVGGADFNDRRRFAALGGGYSSSTTQATGEVVRGAHAACGGFSSLRFEALPATLSETDEITELWTAERGPAVRLTGADANESAFKRLAPGNGVLHVATHGFFLNGRCTQAAETSTRGIGGISYPVENPLLLSGLVLAGANHRESAGADEDDGILTAQEIAALDLSGVQWAVLSACDTGVGEIRAGEGVFGLRRAFQIAGARTVIVSLWAVADEATRLWMRGLYEARLTEGLDTAAAVRQATLEALQRERQSGAEPHPFFWAGFVAAGDWI